MIPNRTQKISTSFLCTERYDLMLKKIHNICEERYAQTGMYCKFDAVPSYKMFSVKDGCHEGGVISVTLSSTADPEKYVTPHRIDEYINECKNVILAIAKEYKQDVVNIDISDVLALKYVACKTIG